ASSPCRRRRQKACHPPYGAALPQSRESAPRPAAISLLRAPCRQAKRQAVRGTFPDKASARRHERNRPPPRPLKLRSSLLRLFLFALRALVLILGDQSGGMGFDQQYALVEVDLRDGRFRERNEHGTLALFGKLDEIAAAEIEQGAHHAIRLPFRIDRQQADQIGLVEFVFVQFVIRQL